mmetsp:Transcript_24408/g.61766  ORF Transcript_24408/g.61766 Transcript_24408/m.61766 type:complete len:124 (-) Transcript_24408:611-982(-)
MRRCSIVVCVLAVTMLNKVLVHVHCTGSASIGLLIFTCSFIFNIFHCSIAKVKRRKDGEIQQMNLPTTSVCCIEVGWFHSIVLYQFGGGHHLSSFCVVLTCLELLGFAMLLLSSNAQQRNSNW